jgi:hypothetical protein
MGWIIHRHGALYAQECGWAETFEALVAEIAAKFIRNLDPKRERCWIAEREGEIVGSARHVYEKAGFRLVHWERHRSFGRDLVGETWELTL